MQTLLVSYILTPCFVYGAAWHGCCVLGVHVDNFDDVAAPGAPLLHHAKIRLRNEGRSQQVKNLRPKNPEHYTLEKLKPENPRTVILINEGRSEVVVYSLRTPYAQTLDSKPPRLATFEKSTC